MSETKYEVLARMDAAINTMLAMRELYFNGLIQELQMAREEQRDEPPTPATAYKKPIMLRQLLVVDTVSRLQNLSGENPTFDEVVEAVWQQYPRGKSIRDQRKTNAGRDLRDVIAAGHLVQNDAGVVSLPATGRA